MNSAAAIADKYITRDGREPKPSTPSKVVWAPVTISEKEEGWIAKAALRSGLLPTRERDGDFAPFLSEIRAMHKRGLVQGMPWRITKFARDCHRELEARRSEPAPVPVLSPPPKINIPVPSGPVRRLADVEREMIESAVSQFKGNKTHAANALGVSVRTVRNKLKEYRSGNENRA